MRVVHNILRLSVNFKIFIYKQFLLLGWDETVSVKLDR
jgi:hypothetical protein